MVVAKDGLGLGNEEILVKGYKVLFRIIKFWVFIIQHDDYIS
jgi:hypothetical protein